MCCGTKIVSGAALEDTCEGVLPPEVLQGLLEYNRFKKRIGRRRGIERYSKFAPLELLVLTRVSPENLPLIGRPNNIR